jgi:hypothetical protein
MLLLLERRKEKRKGFCIHRMMGACDVKASFVIGRSISNIQKMKTAESSRSRTAVFRVFLLDILHAF